MKSIRHHILTPIRFFINDSRSTGVLLLSCTFVSLLLSNSASTSWYAQIWKYVIPDAGKANLPITPLEWINNFLMAFFFVLAAAEIKRELVNGELASFKKAILTIGAAFGGMIFPAIIFAVFSLHSSYSHGWGIPTATDIAFSLAAATLLGKRFPVGLKILLMALAIIDDLGAIVVIALFYGNHIHWLFLGLSGLVCGALFLCNYLKLKLGPIQILLGLLLWYLMLQSGIEASISGVLFAFIMPAGALTSIEKAIHRWVNLGILPLFALANTAILLPTNILGALKSPVGLGVLCGLVIGKPVGIFLTSRLMVAFGMAEMPGNIKWKQFFGMGTLAGIGFTMSIFTTMLAFSESGIQNVAKISILVSALVSVIFSFIYFRFILKSRKTTTVPHKTVTSPIIQLSQA